MKSRVGFISLVFVLVCLAGASCQTTSKQIKVKQPDGQSKTVVLKPKEADALQRARAAKRDGKAEAEEAAWKELLQNTPNTAVSHEAHFRLGFLAYKRASWKDSATHLGEALRSGALSSGDRAQAFHMYGVSLYRLQRWKDALQALEEAYPKLDATEQRNVRGYLVNAAKMSRNDVALLKWQAARIVDLSGTQRDEMKKSIQRTIDGRVPIDKLQLLFNQRGQKITFPFDLIGYRLARGYYHAQQYNQCQDILRRLLGELEQSSSLYPKVKGLHAALYKLADQPRPTVIGAIYPQSGRYQRIGPWVRNAIEMAVAGLGNKVRIIHMDSGSDPKKAVRAVEKLVFQHKAIAIFGPLAKGTSKAAALRAQQLGIPLFSISTREGLADIGSFVFRNNLTLSRMGRAIARYSYEQLSLRRFAVFYPDSSYGRIQVKSFWKEIERLGGQVVGAENYAPGSPDLTDAAERLVGKKHLRQRSSYYKLYKPLRGLKGFRYRRLYKKLVKQFLPVIDFDAIFIPETFRRAATIAPTLAQQDIEVKLHWRFWEKQVIELYNKRNKPLKFVQLLGTNGWNNEKIFAREPRHVVGAIFCVRYFPNSRRQVVRQFVRQYQRRYTEQVRSGNTLRTPIHLSAYTYDTMGMLMKVATGPNPPKTRDAFRRALHKIKGFVGVTGVTSVQKNGEALAYIRYLLAHRKQMFKLKYTAKQLIP